MDGFRDSGWSAYEKLVMDKLDTLDVRQTRLEEQIVLVRLDVASLKVRAGIWGATAGMVPALMTAAVVLVQGGA